MHGRRRARVAIAAASVVALGVTALWLLRARPQGSRQGADQRESERLEMVETTIVRRGIEDESVLAAMRSVPRHRFVLPDYLEQAYADHPLPIGYGQTISQPYIVALMSELLGIQPGDRVLEVGTGSGYQAAVLAEMGAEVYSVEVVPELAASAAERLQAEGYAAVHVAQRDGYYGWEEHAPYRAIIVTAAPDHVPQPLVTQLADGGRLVIPVGPQGWGQVLWVIEKEGSRVTSRQVAEVTFVPLTGSH
jgi:protein-L-isoaspartate(D-aspartate) O-methyltransferase